MSNNPVRFSVILPCYNRADFIEATIRSVLNQQYQYWELIVVNDGSTDNTESIVQSITDERIRYTAIPNSERGAARNTGIKMAKGDFVCFLDSDDQLLTNHLSEANNFINYNEGVKVFHQGYEIKTQAGKVLYTGNNFPRELNKLLIKNNVISPNGIFIDAGIAKENLFIEDRRLAGTEDYELWLRLACKYTIYHHPVITSVLVDHQQRSMKETDLNKLLERITFFLEYVDNNVSVKSWLGKRYNEFNSWRYSYIALHAALGKQKKTALRYLIKALQLYPALVFHKRSYVVLRTLFM